MRLASLLFAIVVIGCAAPTPDEELPVGGETEMGTVPVGQEGELHWNPSRETPFALEPSKCQPRTFASGAISPCVIRSYYDTGAVARIDRFDAAGHPVSTEAFKPTGELEFVTTTTYRADGQAESQSHEDHAIPSRSYRSQWHYRGEGLLLRIDTQRGADFADSTSSEFVRDRSGRLAETRTFADDVLVQRITQTYDADGRIVKTWRSHNGDPWTAFEEETFEFHPNGALARRARTVDGPGGGWSEARFDEQARPTLTSSTMGESGGSATWRYGGKLGFMRARWGNSGTDRDDWGETDSAGRSLRTLSHYTYFFNPDRDLWLHHRLTYVCGTDKVVRDDFDRGNDGTIDGTREWTYDEAGNVTLEVASGAMKNLSGYPRVEYDYSCR